MNRLEEITRDAANAIGMDVSLFEWDESVRGLRLSSFNAPTIFAPLSRPADAFKVESALCVNVNYRSNGKSVAICTSCEKHPEIGHMATAPVDDKHSQLKARMLTVTTFAALFDLAERE